MRHNAECEEETRKTGERKNSMVMGTAASGISPGKASPECLSREELKDPKSVMFECVCTGNDDQLLVVLQQGMDPNERESPSSR